MLLPAVLVAVVATGLVIPPAPAAPGPKAKAVPGPHKVPAAVLRAVEGRDKSAGAVTDNTVHTDADGRVELDFHAAEPTGGAEEADLARLGAAAIKSLDLSPDLHVTTGMIEAWLPPDTVTAAADLPWVTSVTVPAYGHTNAVTSAGVALHKANLAQAKGINGTGVTVGVVSGGAENLAAAQASGDLSAVKIVDPTTFGAGTGDEGTAMLEIVHDVAPGAALDFHADGIGGVTTPLTLVTAFDALRKAGANVIVHDVGFLDAPVFQSGVVAQVIDGLTSLGVSVHSAAGNSGDTHTARVTATGSGGGPEGKPGPFPHCGVTPPTNAVGIGPGGKTSFEVTLFPNEDATFVLQWSEPRSIFPTAGQGGFTDLDLFLMTDDLSDCLDFSNAGQGNGAGDTLEGFTGHLVGPVPVKAKLVVSRFIDPAITQPITPPTLDLRWDGAAAVDPPTRLGSIDPDNNFTSGLPAAAAAVDAATGQMEPYSAGGPVDLFTTTGCPAGTTKAEDEECPATPGTNLGTFPGPAWTAADNVAVSGAGGFTTPFRGTSAAAPHAAGCDALVRQAIGHPDAPVEAVHERLASTAVDIDASGADPVSGAGILDCVAASAVSDTALTNQVSSTGPAPGDTVAYTLAVTNNGPDPGTRLALSGTLPDGVTFASSGSGCTAAGQDVSCPLADLAKGERRSFTFDATVAPDLAGGTQLVSTAEVVSPFDVSLADNTATATATVVVPPPPPIVGNLAATGPVQWPTFPMGVALMAAAMIGIGLTRGSRSGRGRGGQGHPRPDQNG